jgi:hypothetical protein
MSEINHQCHLTRSSSNYSIASILNLSQTSPNIQTIHENNKQKGTAPLSKDLTSFQSNDNSKKKENVNGKVWSSIITQLELS